MVGILYVPFGQRFSRMKGIVGLGIPLRSLWPTLPCRQVAGGSPLLSIGWWYLSWVTPKRHCCRFRSAGKGWRVYPLHPRPDAVALYSECTPGKRRAWFLPDDRHNASLVGLRGGWRHARMKLFLHAYGSNAAVPGLPFDSGLHKSLNLRRVVISEPDLMCTPEAETLEGFSGHAATVLEPQPPTPVSDTMLSAANIIITPNEPSSSIVSASPSDPDVLAPSASTTTTDTHTSETKLQNSSTEKKKKELPKEQKPEIKINTTPRPTRRFSYQDEDIIYEAEQIENINQSLTPTRYRN
ncbi:uncharacterized protein TNCV_3803041 [Trichonephila clavipes]|nr:uncharacterized protein TNCV_3803041 [Trichonephila clavipes]